MRILLSMGVMAVLAAGVLPVLAQSTQEKLAANRTQISLADARSRIDKAIETPAVMTAIMKHLSAADQKQFLGDVNKAISDLPASVEEKSANFLNVNHAALKGAAKGNATTLIAEVFATVPAEALTIINERFAIDLLNRSADANTVYSDAQFEKIALDVMAKVNERCEETDNAAPRSAFAMLMLLRAANGSPADLSDKLIDTLKTDEAREMARNEWIPAALGKEDRAQSYESLLASADAGRRPDRAFVLVIAGPQFGDSILHDLSGKNSDPLSFMSTRTPVLDAVENPIVHASPNLGGGQVEQTTIRPESGANIVIGSDGKVHPDPGPEPSPYQWQRTK